MTIKMKPVVILQSIYGSKKIRDKIESYFSDYIGDMIVKIFDNDAVYLTEDEHAILEKAKKSENLYIIICDPIKYYHFQCNDIGSVIFLYEDRESMDKLIKLYGIRKPLDYHSYQETLDMYFNRLNLINKFPIDYDADPLRYDMLLNVSEGLGYYHIECIKQFVYANIIDDI